MWTHGLRRYIPTWWDIHEGGGREVGWGVGLVVEGGGKAVDSNVSAVMEQKATNASAHSPSHSQNFNSV